MKIVGLEFAPLNIPLQRRLQTVAVFFWISCFLFFGFGGFLLFFTLLFTNYYYIPLLYLIWFWYDFKTSERGGRRSEWIRNWPIWHWMRDYFPVRLIKTVELDPKKNYICGYHPHGIFCVGAFISLCTEAVGFSKLFHRIKPYLLILNGHFQFPFYRDHLLLLGLCSVDRKSIKWLLNYEGTGNMVTIVIGGALEALEAHPGKVSLVLRNRKGFVRLALQEGASLVPIFSFGENELYTQVNNPPGSLLRRIQTKFIKFMGFPSPIIQGRGIFQYTLGYLPFRKPVDVIVGEPIDIEKNPNPSEEVVSKYHQKYIDSLTKLFDKHKSNYESYKNVALQID